MPKIESVTLENLSNDTLLEPFSSENIPRFQQLLLEWFEREGRHDLPWKPQAQFSEKINLYRIWISEIMLQQTQVATVLPYFERFMQTFPTPESLASADEEEVLKLWEGLGYYSRARNLHHAAKKLVHDFNGEMPREFEKVRSLKGVGDTTASAILSQGFNLPFAILDGNVRRVLARIIGMTAPRKELDRRLKPFADAFACPQNAADYTQAIMDFGATLCKRKAECERCFFNQYCVAYKHQEVVNIPKPNPPKIKPVESLLLPIFRAPNGDILLEKRPATGIWANLYSLPEIVLKGRNHNRYHSLLFKHAPQWLELAQTRTASPNSPPLFRHQFSHYTLEGSPKIIELTDEETKALTTSLQNVANLRQDLQFYNANAVTDLPKPAPIVTLFASLYTEI